jgi:hypothetical protein
MMIPLESRFTKEPYEFIRADDSTAIISNSGKSSGATAIAVIGTELISLAAPRYAGDSRSVAHTETTDLSLTHSVRPPDVAKEDSSANSVTERLNAARLELLARRYVNGSLAKEQEARLSIATQKILRLIPGATPEDYGALGVILERAAEVRSANSEARRRLGLE